jgi:trimethylamine--corrinoid protein Co-methyltransferase
MNYASSHGEGIAYRTLTAEQIHDIHSASCRILEEVGVIVHHDEAAELLKKWGAYIDADGRTHIPEAMVKRALHTAPSRITVYNRLGEPVIWLEKSNVHFGAGSDTLIYLDPFTGERRSWTSQDVAAAVRVVDALPQLDFVMSMGMLSDVDIRMINRVQYALMIKNSVKPQVVIAEDASTVADIQEMAAAAVGGKEKLKHRPHFVLYCEPTSPLQLPFESIDKLLFAADIEQDMLKTGFTAFFPQPAAVHLTMTIKRRYQDSPGITLNGSMDELLLGDHHPKIDHLETSISKAHLQYFVANSMNIRTDYTKDYPIVPRQRSGLL